MEDELFGQLYRLIVQIDKRRPRRKRLQFNDAIILSVVIWSALHERPICWACSRKNWSERYRELWLDLPSAQTMSDRLRTVSLHLLLEQVFYHLLAARALCGFCLCRRIDSKPLPVGGFSKDRDARWGYATGGKYRGYKMFCGWGKDSLVPEAMVLGPMNCSDQAGAMHLIDGLQSLYAGNACGYLVADSTHDTNLLHEHAGRCGLQLLCPRKEPYSGLGHCPHSPYRLRSIQMLEGDPDPMAFALHDARGFGRGIYRQRGQIERDLGQLCCFGGGLQPLPAWVRRPHRVALWVILKLIINGLRIQHNHGLTV